jgi:hypothetical protein
MLYQGRGYRDWPTLEHVYDPGCRVCEVPVVVGPYLVVTAESAHAVLSLDLRHSPRRGVRPGVGSPEASPPTLPLLGRAERFS